MLVAVVFKTSIDINIISAKINMWSANAFKVMSFGEELRPSVFVVIHPYCLVHDRTIYQSIENADVVYVNGSIGRKVIYDEHVQTNKAKVTKFSVSLHK